MLQIQTEKEIVTVVKSLDILQEIAEIREQWDKKGCWNIKTMRTM